MISRNLIRVRATHRLKCHVRRGFGILVPQPSVLRNPHQCTLNHGGYFRVCRYGRCSLVISRNLIRVRATHRLKCHVRRGFGILVPQPSVLRNTHQCTLNHGGYFRVCRMFNEGSLKLHVAVISLKPKVWKHIFPHV